MHWTVVIISQHLSKYIVQPDYTRFLFVNYILIKLRRNNDRNRNPPFGKCYNQAKKKSINVKLVGKEHDKQFTYTLSSIYLQGINYKGKTSNIMVKDTDRHYLISNDHWSLPVTNQINSVLPLGRNKGVTSLLWWSHHDLTVIKHKQQTQTKGHSTK